SRHHAVRARAGPGRRAAYSRRRRPRHHRAACTVRRRRARLCARREISAARRAFQRRSPAHLQYRSLPAVQAYAAIDAATMVIVQFESNKAIAHADEIVAVEGVDMVLIGTNDLLADWGLPGQYDHPRVREAYAATIAACRRHGKHAAVGGFASRPDLAAEYVRMGARYVSTGTDLGFLLAACAAKAKEVTDMAAGGN